MKQLKILIIGKNSLTGSNLFDFLKKKYLAKIVSFEDKILNQLDQYDYIINCSINQKYIQNKYEEKNDFDLKIIKRIKSTKTKFIFLSSRKIYLPAPNIKENSKKNFINNYEKNKYITEEKIIELHKNKSAILRISNLIGFKKNNLRKAHLTYLDYLLKTISEGKIHDNEKKFKDFLDMDSFCKIIHLVIKNKIIGTYNVSIGVKIYLNEINRWILHYFKPKNKLKICHLNNKEDDKSFFLNNSKLLKKINLEINKQKLKKECLKLSKELFK